MTYTNHTREITLPWTTRVDALEDLTFGHILPLLRSSWLGRSAFDTCLSVHWRTLEQLLLAATRTVGGSWHDAAYAPEDVAAGALERVLGRAVRHEGLALAPSDWSAPAATWLFVVLTNAVRDELRRSASTLEGEWVREDEAVDHLARSPSCADAYAAREEVIRRVEHALQHLDGRYRLAWLLLHQPQLVDLAVVHGAIGGTDRSRDRQGPLRSPRRTFELLDSWRERFANDPRCSASRLELAWILRSEDQLDPWAWRQERPLEERRARDVLRKWHGRAQTRLATLKADDRRYA